MKKKAYLKYKLTLGNYITIRKDSRNLIYIRFGYYTKYIYKHSTKTSSNWHYYCDATENSQFIINYIKHIKNGAIVVESLSSEMFKEYIYYLGVFESSYEELFKLLKKDGTVL